MAGRVTVGGTPAAGAEVTLHPVEAEWSKDWPHRPFGKVGADGGVTFSTFAANDGAPAGKYAVTIGWVGEDRETDKLGGVHTNPNRSGAITTEVAHETTQLPPIDLPAPPRGR